MGDEIAVDEGGTEVVEIDAQSLAPYEAKCGNQVAIGGDDDDRVDEVQEGKAGHVEADAQVDSLLLDEQLEILGAHVTRMKRECGAS